MSKHKSPPFAPQSDSVETQKLLIRRVRELDALLEIGKTVTALFDVDAILRKVVNAAVRLTNAEAGMLLLVDPETDDLFLRAEQNIGESEAQNFKIRISDSISGQVVQSGKPITLNADDLNFKVKTGITVKALINVPLTSGNTVIGVLGVHNQDRSTIFNENHLRVVQALADWAAIAVTNARLYQQSQRGAKSQDLINEITRSILSSLHVEEIPHKLIQHSTEILGAECGSLALVDDATQELVFQLAYDDQGKEITEMTDLRFPLGQGIIGAVAADGRPRIVNDVRHDRQWYGEVDHLIQFETQEVLAVPLLAEGQILGVVELLNKRDGDFNQHDQDLLMAVASAAAIAIQNARQYQALVDTHRDLREAQQQRIAAEQWSILGRAAAGLAHRIHNTTAVVPASAQDLREILTEVKMSPDLRDEVEANLSRIERNTIYTLDLADGLLRRFNHRPVAENDVNALVERAIGQANIPDSVRLVANLAPELPKIDTSNLLADVILELVSNSIKAMPDGGLLTINTRATDTEIIIQVMDTGVGISPDKQKKIFNLFYGQDEVGLGFGLWWVKTFLQQHRGVIEINSTEGEGAAFTVRLPIPEKRSA
ncbi:MAG: GAF domain-containing protein [Chloroflexota bacterium]